MADWVWENWAALMVAAYGVCGLVICWAAWPRRKRCGTCEGVGFTEAAAFMTTDGETPPRCPDCGGARER